MGWRGRELLEQDSSAGFLEAWEASVGQLTRARGWGGLVRLATSDQS